MDKGGGKNKWLIGALIALVALIVGLVVAIIVINNSSQINEQKEEAETTDENFDSGLPNLEEQKQYVEDYANSDVSYQISTRISEVYNSGNKDEALRMYDEEISKALAAQNYQLFAELVGTRSTMLFFGDECERAVGLYDNIDISSLPDNYQLTLTAMALGDSSNCGNEEKEQYWNNKYNEILGDRRNDEDVRP